MTQEEKMRITRLLGVGVGRKVENLHAGWLGYANGWYQPFGDGSWFNGGMERFLIQLCREQKVKFDDTSTSKERGYHHYVSQYNISYDVDSSG